VAPLDFEVFAIHPMYAVPELLVATSYPERV
jgi:hypothetical protein